MVQSERLSCAQGMGRGLGKVHRGQDIAVGRLAVAIDHQHRLTSQAHDAFDRSSGEHLAQQPLAVAPITTRSAFIPSASSTITLKGRRS